MLDADETVWDQNAFNDIFRRVVKTDDSRSDRLFWCAPLPCHLACRVGLAWDKGTRARVQSGLQGGLPAAERAAAAHAMLASGCAEQGVDLQPRRCHPAAGAVVQHAYLPPAGLVWLMHVQMELSSRHRKPRRLPRSAASRMCRPGSWRLHGCHARRTRVYKLGVCAAQGVRRQPAHGHPAGGAVRGRAHVLRAAHGRARRPGAVRGARHVPVLRHARQAAPLPRAHGAPPPPPPDPASATGAPGRRSVRAWLTERFLPFADVVAANEHGRPL